MKWKNDTFLKTRFTRISGKTERLSLKESEQWYTVVKILRAFGSFSRRSALVKAAKPSQSLQKIHAAMDKDQLISMIHLLVKREDERAQENLELKDMVKELRDTHKQDVKTQTNLLKSIDKLTNQVADLATQNRMISERIAELAQTLPSRD